METDGRRWKGRRVRSESPRNLAGVKKKGGVGGMETGNQLLGQYLALALLAATRSLEVCEGGKARMIAAKAKAFGLGGQKGVGQGQSCSSCFPA